MAKKILPVPITKEFEPTLEGLNKICVDRPYNRSELIRRAIKFVVALHNTPANKRKAMADTFIQNLLYKPNKIDST
jgi:hypothetical protein